MKMMDTLRDIAADILKAIWGRDISDREREYLCNATYWPGV